MNGQPAAPSPGSDGKRRLTYDVRIWKTRIVNGAKGRTYQVRWTVAGKVHYATFGTKALADSHEAKLRTAARQGEAFDVVTGLPLSAASEDEGRDQEPEHDVTWYEFACAYVDMKWDEMSPNSRRSIADSLATATTALLATKRGAPKPAQLRKALYGWAFNTKRREAGPPAGLATAIALDRAQHRPAGGSRRPRHSPPRPQPARPQARRPARSRDGRGAQARRPVQPARLRGGQEALPR